MIKKIVLLLIILAQGLASFAILKPNVYEIDAENNAYIHNNLGLNYVAEKWYPAAIEEFKIAISLNPNTQATATYYTNLGDTYMRVGLFKYAQDCYERAIKQYNLNFLYYQNLVRCFKAQNVLKLKIEYYEKNTKNPLDMVVLGLLYIESGDMKRGIIKLDEFCMQEPNLIITSAIRAYLKTKVSSFK